MFRLLMSALALVGTSAQTMGYDWNGFAAWQTVSCGTNSGVLNVGLSQSLPTGATGLKVKQIAFAIYGTNALPAFIQLHGSTGNSRLSTSGAMQCCGSSCDLAVQVIADGWTWYNSPCGQPSCPNANKWYYMDFSGTAVGTTEQTGISEATFWNSGGSQIGANMINLGSGSVFFMSYTVIIPSPTPTPSVTKSPVSPSLTASETGSRSISRSVSASESTDRTSSRSESASRTDSRTTSRSMSASRAPSVSRTTSASATATSTGVCSDARTYFTGVWTTVVHATATYHVRHWVNVTHDLTPPVEQFIGANPTCTQTSTTCTCVYTGGDNTGGCTINRYATITYTYGSPQTTTYTTQSPLCAYFFASTIFIPSRTPSTSMSISTTRSTAPSVSSTVSPTQTPYLPWFQGLVGCCHNSLDTSVQALNVLTPYPFPNMGINRISIQYWPLSAGTASFTIALMNVGGGSMPGGSILASKTFSVVSPGSFPTYSQQVATFTDLDPISSYVLGGDVEYALAFYNATPGIIDLVLGVPSLSPYFWNSLMPEATGSFYTVGETDPTTAFWYQSTNIAFVAVGAGPAISSSPSISMSRSSSSSLSATTSSSPSVTTAVSESATTSSSSSGSPTTTVSATGSSSSSTSGSPTTAVSQSTSVSTSASSSSSSSVTPIVTVTQSSSSSMTPIVTVTQSSSSSMTPIVTVSQSSSSSMTPIVTVSQSSSSSVTPAVSQSPSPSSSVTPAVSQSPSPSSSVTPTAAVSESSSSSALLTTTVSQSTTISASTSSISSLSISLTTAVSQSMSISATPSSTSSTTPSSSLSVSISASRSMTVSSIATTSESTSSTLSQSQSLSLSATAASTPSMSATASDSPSLSVSISTSLTRSGSSSLSTSRSSSSSESMSLSPTPSTTVSSSVFPTASLSKTESPSDTSRATSSTSSDKSGSPSVSFSISVSITSSTSITLSPSPQSFQQVSNTTMSATSTPQFFTTSFPTVTPTYSPTQNATLPIIVVDGQATNMTTTNALLGSTLALIIVAVALAAGRYLPVGWAQRFRRMIPQKTIDDFKRDPLGSVTAAVNDPKSILKNLQIPGSVQSIADMVPKDIKDKFVPDSIQKLITPSAASVPHVDANTEDEKTERPSTPKSRQAPPPLRVEHAPEPKQDVEEVTGITEDLGVIVQTTKEPIIRQSSSILQINTEDLAAVQAYLKQKGTDHKVIS